MKKFAILVITLICVFMFTTVATAQTIDGQPENDREYFSARIWECTRYMAEGEGELSAVAFSPDFVFALFDYTNDDEAIEDQELLVYDMSNESLVYDIKSWDALSLELIEKLSLIYEGEQVPSTLFDGFNLDCNAPGKLFNYFYTKYNCTVLRYGA